MSKIKGKVFTIAQYVEGIVVLIAVIYLYSIFAKYPVKTGVKIKVDGYQVETKSNPVRFVTVFRNGDTLITREKPDIKSH